MRKIRLKPVAISLIYFTVTISIVISLMLIGQDLLKTNPDVNYITSSTITEEVKPVVKEEKKINRPYQDNDVKILQNYYDYQDNKENQEKSLIFYENTYIQNSGVDYGRQETFDVLSIYPGTVIDVREDNILGKIVDISHSNNLIASYQCLENVNVKKNDTVVGKEIIGTSGTCNIDKELGNHLHLEVSLDGKMINPEKIYEKGLKEINVQ